MEEMPPMYEMKRKYWVFVGYGPCPERFRKKWYTLYHIQTLDIPDKIINRQTPCIVWLDYMIPEQQKQLRILPSSQMNVIHLRVNNDVDDIDVWSQIDVEELETIHELTFFKYMISIRRQNFHNFESI